MMEVVVWMERIGDVFVQQYLEGHKEPTWLTCSFLELGYLMTENTTKAPFRNSSTCTQHVKRGAD